MAKNPILTTKCRNILAEYQDVIDLIKGEIIAEVDSERFNEADAFSYAKKAIRREAVREALLMFETRINNHAAE
jgi:hypothetical protein